MWCSPPREWTKERRKRKRRFTHIPSNSLRRSVNREASYSVRLNVAGQRTCQSQNTSPYSPTPGLCPCFSPLYSFTPQLYLLFISPFPPFLLSEKIWEVPYRCLPIARKRAADLSNIPQHSTKPSSDSLQKWSTSPFFIPFENAKMRLKKDINVPLPNV